MIDCVIAKRVEPARAKPYYVANYITNRPSKDILWRGGDFYAVFDESTGLWSTCAYDAYRLIDETVREKIRAAGKDPDREIVRYLGVGGSGADSPWNVYKKLSSSHDSGISLDSKLTFANTQTKREDYASKRLTYNLEPGECPNWDRLIGTLYSPEERHKLEWAIGCVVSGDSIKTQKFIAIYGDPGSGKSTILKIVEAMFTGYTANFSAMRLGNRGDSFALEQFRTNPLVAIDHDADMSKLNDNTRFNSIVSHETISVNSKGIKAYNQKFNSFIFVASNEPVNITDSKSGLLRRLIDVQPSGSTVPPDEYDRCIEGVKYEYGAIAWHCLQVYNADKRAYGRYKPTRMLEETNPVYDFVSSHYEEYSTTKYVTLASAWEAYKAYMEDCGLPEWSRVTKAKFKAEMRHYFGDYQERVYADGKSMYNVFCDIKPLSESEEEPAKTEPEDDTETEVESEKFPEWLFLSEQPSYFDMMRSSCYAQLANEDGNPKCKWDSVGTRLCDIDTSQLHFVRPPSDHIVIDFDLKNEAGEKDIQLNLAAAAKFPKTYAEVSKGGQGLHLHYIYKGDVAKLASHMEDDANIEIKVFRGKSALRRKLTKCNAIPPAILAGGLPLKEVKTMKEMPKGVQSASQLERQLKAVLTGEYGFHTGPAVDFIKHLFDEAYAAGFEYDLSRYYNDVVVFAMNSTNQAERCLKVVNTLKFKSAGLAAAEAKPMTAKHPEKLIFFDIEVFPNVLLVNWKYEGKDAPMVRMVNPTPAEVARFLNLGGLVGFNNRRYDNHILYAASLGYSNEELYRLSSAIVSDDKDASANARFKEAYNLSYTDVYDFCSKKQSLKKWEIELGIHHQELAFPWDQPLPEEHWEECSEYCDNDVIATEAVFNARKADFTARQILADVAGRSVNTTTNSLTMAIIFGNNRKPKLNYRFMGIEEVPFDLGGDEYTVFDNQGRPEFPGYKFEDGVSTYRGEEVGEGGYVYSEPGIYHNVALLDIASMHPSSLVAENYFGEYTARYKEILDARLAIKHKDYDKARSMLGGALSKYLGDESSAKDLAQALKIVINSVYGLTAAKFENACRDPRNVDNIVAKRGALFMINLKHEVMKRGFTVAHIKTDSIKIPDATPEIIEFVMEYGKKYQYNFEHEATYDRMCLVNDAVYIAKYADGGHAGEWTATGKQFQVPYVFKSLFTHEDITFDDLCETFAVSSGASINFRIDGEDPMFLGRVCRVCPVSEADGGKELIRVDKTADGEIRYAAPPGSKGYFWKEAETVKALGLEHQVDRTYWNELRDAAADAIRVYGDFDEFAS